MKWQMIFILGILVGSLAFVNAQNNTNTTTATGTVQATTSTPVAVGTVLVDGDVCPNSSELEQQAELCVKYGLNPQKISKNGCTYIQCEQKNVCPTPEQLRADAVKCEQLEGDPRYYTSKDNCTYVGCWNTSVACASKEELDKVVHQCKEKGYNYEYLKQDDGCIAVECKEQRTCKFTPEELERQSVECVENGGKPTRYSDEKNCSYLNCQYESKCNSSVVLQQQADACTRKGLGVFTFLDNYGCKAVQCDDGKKPQTTVECKKIINDNGCVEVHCGDGFRYDSCEQQQVCKDLECKTYKDSKGCKVKSCNDGSQSTVCPTSTGIPTVTCEVIEKDDGCQVKECTDAAGNATRSEYCPTKQKCSVERDVEGCDVKKCVDTETGKQTYHARSCGPDAVQATKIECKVFKSENGDLVKTCNNGLELNYAQIKKYCEAAGVQFDPDNLKDGVKCPYGENAEYVVNGNGVECRIDLGAQTQHCTDGTADKGPGRLTGPAPTTTPVPTSNPGGFDLFRFLRSIFGGN